MIKLNFNSYNLKGWKKEYLNKSFEIILKTAKYDENINVKYLEYKFNSYEELNEWLSDPINLIDEEYIKSISETNIYEFDYDKYNKQFS